MADAKIRVAYRQVDNQTFTNIPLPKGFGQIGFVAPVKKENKQ
jgi:hypothetical protein